MSRFDLVILDYDGVIADSELLNNLALAEVLTGIGLPTTLDQALGLYMGRRWLDCRPDIEARLGRACPNDVLSDWTRLCYERAATALRPVAGAVAFMGALKQPRCIASSSPPDWIALGLATMGVAPRDAGPIFSAAVHVTRGKPTRTSSCTPPRRWARRRIAPWSSRTARRASRRASRPA